MENSNEKKKSLSFKESWQVIFWSFYYSRGDQPTQNCLLEYFKRKNGFSFFIKVLPIPKKILQETIKFRKSRRHKQTRDLAKIYSDRDLVSSSIKELLKQVNIIKGAEVTTNSEELKRLPTEKLLNKIAYKITRLDRERQKSGFPNSHTTEHFLSDTKMPGGKPYEQLRKDLLPLIKKMLNRNL